MLSGWSASGSPGARSSNRNMIRLMSTSVGIANNNRRNVKVSIGDASVQQFGAGNVQERGMAPPVAGPFFACIT
jgi:hypothetical protein